MRVAQNHSMSDVQPAATYAGDISPELAWAWVQSGEATLVDVRSDAERAWVGFVPGGHALAWKQWPGMAMNPAFDEGVKTLGAGGPNWGCRLTTSWKALKGTLITTRTAA